MTFYNQISGRHDTLENHTCYLGKRAILKKQNSRRWLIPAFMEKYSNQLQRLKHIRNIQKKIINNHTRIVCAKRLAKAGCKRGGRGNFAASLGCLRAAAARTRARSCRGATTRHTRAVHTTPPAPTNRRRAAWPHVNAVTRAYTKVGLEYIKYSNEKRNCENIYVSF